MLVIFFFVTITMWVAVGGGLALLMVSLCIQSQVFVCSYVLMQYSMFVQVSSDICFDPDQVVRDFADDNGGLNEV